MLFRRFFKNVPWKVSAINFLLNVLRSLSTSPRGFLVGLFVGLLFFLAVLGLRGRMQTQ